MFVVYVFAVVAQNYSTSLNVHDRETARQYGKASIILSVIGLIVGVLAYVLILCMVVLGAAAAVVECPYPIDGQCYKHRSMESVADCILKMGHYVSPYCYYN